ncbi:hypothetical protein PVT68_05365 [Microbulbifer bruguierae]|uniref:Uncharacterized protein n=1 Tax=Microbulbifer bruguierae TaxID=3029061 RepID=A0ABY8NH85_9GAMM|nr:hypothetical protein [Microbulbifer bruguierae]WGL17724.1 hypothetical protein PVT68_05365 [Microbulbifer bruguierae]
MSFKELPNWILGCAGVLIASIVIWMAVTGTKVVIGDKDIGFVKPAPIVPIDDAESVWAFESLVLNVLEVEKYLNSKKVPPEALQASFKNIENKNWVNLWIRSDFEPNDKKWKIEYIPASTGHGNQISLLLRKKNVVLIGYTHNSKHFYYAINS